MPEVGLIYIHKEVLWLDFEAVRYFENIDQGHGLTRLDSINPLSRESQVLAECLLSETL